ncbi:ligase-associated DNA damage response endonuclease PdeM [Paraburkholderia bannensis]|uniref:ligase-associated DNA damage response endonuclease PdeM n=1 Tax=Paraburkholderia bannensis TaxID=765414 RepID=UPI002AB14B0F|nr:ligase-associated DNA damage response endonuclease PdeM [Paraburkholderia bannensis]
MSAETLTIDVGGRMLTLSAWRAAFDPVFKSLFVADVHLGKDAVFRARGVPVPVGSTLETLGRLDNLIAEHRPEAIFFLGDLLHARESHAEEMLSALRDWRLRHSNVRLVLVEGNHDRHAGALADEFGVETVSEPYRLGPWALCHHVQTVEGAYVLAGHEHPVIRLATGFDRVRLPCFRFGAHVGVLPAFGAFTGGFEVRADAADDEVYAVAGERVVRVRNR